MMRHLGIRGVCRYKEGRGARRRLNVEVGKVNVGWDGQRGSPVWSETVESPWSPYLMALAYGYLEAFEEVNVWEV